MQINVKAPWPVSIYVQVTTRLWLDDDYQEAPPSLNKYYALGIGRTDPTALLCIPTKTRSD